MIMGECLGILINIEFYIKDLIETTVIIFGSIYGIDYYHYVILEVINQSMSFRKRPIKLELRPYYI
jgi:hypothetical protein